MLETRYAIRRRDALRRAVSTHDVESVLVTRASDIRYLCGATEGVSGLLMGSGWAVAVTSRMFEWVVPRQAPGCEVAIGRSLQAVLTEELRQRGCHRAIGIQGTVMSWAQHESLRKALGRRALVDVGPAIAAVRAVKDEHELRLIRRCVRLAERAFRELLAQGSSHLLAHAERELAAELEYRMRMLGADRQGFQGNGIIVASGPHSACCHHAPTHRRVRRGEPLLFDWGAERDGYRCDITRVVFPGTPLPRWPAVYEAVRLANRAGVRAARAGVMCETVARKGWAPVREAGFGDLIRHGLGHGLGLDIHESPGIGDGGSQSAAAPGTRLRRGMVVTIEPGVYLDREGGVRIEDDLLVTTGDPRCLTSLPRELADAVLP